MLLLFLIILINIKCLCYLKILNETSMRSQSYIIKLCSFFKRVLTLVVRNHELTNLKGFDDNLRDV